VFSSSVPRVPLICPAPHRYGVLCLFNEHPRFRPKLALLTLPSVAFVRPLPRLSDLLNLPNYL